MALDVVMDEFRPIVRAHGSEYHRSSVTGDRATYKLSTDVNLTAAPGDASSAFEVSPRTHEVACQPRRTTGVGDGSNFQRVILFAQRTITRKWRSPIVARIEESP